MEDTDKKQLVVLPGWLQLGMKTGGAFGLVSVTTWKFWSAVNPKEVVDFLKRTLNALLISDGPWPVLLFLACAIIFGFYVRSTEQVKIGKDAEIDRLVKWVDQLQEKLGVSHPHSGDKGGHN